LTLLSKVKVNMLYDYFTDQFVRVITLQTNISLFNLYCWPITKESHNFFKSEKLFEISF